MSEKIEKILEILEEMDDLDNAAWYEVVKKAESERVKEYDELTSKNVKFGNEVLKDLIPMIRLVRFSLAHPSIDQATRVMIVERLINELIVLLNSVETSGVLWSLMFNSYCTSGRRPIPVVMDLSKMFSTLEEEDKDNKLVI